MQSRYNQLDGLRALAALAVVACHWGPSLHIRGINWVDGALGVNLFFVISGFLITGILLDAKGGGSWAFVLKQFYARRFLRIFPIYYAALLLSCLLLEPVRHAWPWHASYLSNVYFFNLNAWDVGGHFWSLSVEEQFYLLWPLLMVFLPSRWIPYAIAIVIAIAPIWGRYLGVIFPGKDLAFLFLPSWLDCLGIGAMLAWAERSGVGLSKMRWGIGGLACLSWVFWHTIPQGGSLRLFTWAMAFGFLVGSAAVGDTGCIGRLLCVKPLMALGQVSYGFYLFHQLVPSWLDWVMRKSGLLEPTNWHGLAKWVVWLLMHPWMRVALWFAVTTSLAILSWRYFERPINDLKRHFPYSPRSVTPIDKEPSKTIAG